MIQDVLHYFPWGINSRQSLVQPNDENCLGVASELVHVSDELHAAVQLILGQTLIVRDRETARRLINDLPPHARIVTLRGEVFRGDGLIIAGKTASSAGSTLSRPRQKRELTESLTALSAQIESLNAEVDSLSAKMADAQREQAQTENVTRELRIRLDEAQGYEQQAGLESESMRRQLDWQKSQHQQLKAEADEAASIRQNLIHSQSELESQSVEAVDDVHVLSEKLGGMDLMEAAGSGLLLGHACGGGRASYAGFPRQER